MQPAEQEIVLDRLVEKQPPSLWRDRREAARNAMRRKPGNVFASHPDRTAALLDQAHDRLEHSRLAGAVGPEQRDRLALADVERNVAHDVEAAVTRRERGDVERRALLVHRRSSLHSPR